MADPCPDCGVQASDACPRGVEEACPRAALGKAQEVTDSYSPETLIETPPKASKAKRTRVVANPTPETFRRIAEHIASGKSFDQACALPGMPHITTLWRWLRTKEPDGSLRYPELRSLIEEAKAQRPDAWAEQLIDIADGKGQVPKAKLRITTRQWLLERARPNEFGQHVTVHQPDRDGLSVDDMRPIARALVAALGADGLAELRRLAAPTIDEKAEEIIDGA
jgi:hypothetical protein